MRDKDIGMGYRLIAEDTGAIIGYVAHEHYAREISQSSGVAKDQHIREVSAVTA